MTTEGPGKSPGIAFHEHFVDSLAEPVTRLTSFPDLTESGLLIGANTGRVRSQHRKADIVQVRDVEGIVQRQPRRFRTDPSTTARLAKKDEKLGIAPTMLNHQIRRSHRERLIVGRVVDGESRLIHGVAQLAVESGRAFVEADRERRPAPQPGRRAAHGTEHAEAVRLRPVPRTFPNSEDRSAGGVRPVGR